MVRESGVVLAFRSTSPVVSILVFAAFCERRDVAERSACGLVPAVFRLNPFKDASRDAMSVPTSGEPAIQRRGGSGVRIELERVFIERSDRLCLKCTIIEVHWCYRSNIFDNFAGDG